MIKRIVKTRFLRLSVISVIILGTLQAQERSTVSQSLVAALVKHDATLAKRLMGETKAQEIQTGLVAGLLNQPPAKALRFDEKGAIELVTYFGKIGEQVARPNTTSDELAAFQTNQKRFFAAFLREAQDIAAGGSLNKEKVDRILDILPRKYVAQGRCWPFW